ncbi:MAG: hypothetical protein H0V29_01560 [Thermoleophilaceae bacterium]|nr:hypothetical protein [Thermoleophilaceae bacterium]
MDSCLPSTTLVARRAIGPVRVGDARSRMASMAGTPTVVARVVYSYCVAGGGFVRAVFGERARSRLVLTTASVHTAAVERRRSVADLIERALPVGRGLWRDGLTVYGVRGKRVSFVAVVDRGLAKSPKRLRRYVVLARKG